MTYKELFQLTAIGTLCGIVLAGSLLVIYAITGNEAYILLFNVDYIPVLKDFPNEVATGILLHFVISIGSVIGLYYFLRYFQLENRILLYIFVYTPGSAALFFLTALTDSPPSATDFSAWFYWVISHLIYSVIVGILVKYWMN